MSVQVIAIDKANAEARKELQKIRGKIQAAKAEDKKVQTGAVHAYTSGLETVPSVHVAALPAIECAR